jgi:predicted tellurium resistance membrane protein TerC
MMTKLKMAVLVALGWVGTTQVALADFTVPEPGTLPLVAFAVAAAVYIIRRRK